jgi:hypothetical protein
MILSNCGDRFLQVTTGDAFLVLDWKLWMKIHSKGFPFRGATVAQVGIIKNFISPGVIVGSLLLVVIIRVKARITPPVYHQHHHVFISYLIRSLLLHV